MKSYTWNYSIKGMMTFMPMFVTVEAASREDAEAAAHTKIGPDGTLWGDPEIKDCETGGRAAINLSQMVANSVRIQHKENFPEGTDLDVFSYIKRREAPNPEDVSVTGKRMLDVYLQYCETFGYPTAMHDFGFRRDTGDAYQFAVPATEHSIECLKDTNPEAYARIMKQIEERDAYPRPTLGYAHKVYPSEPRDPINMTVIMKKGKLTEAGQEILKKLQESKRNNCPPEEDSYILGSGGTMSTGLPTD
jgi:hypothetical protein